MRATLSAIVLACFISQASAVTIELEFTGLANGIRPTYINGINDLGSFHGKPFTAEFIYDTDLGVLGDHRLDGGLVNAFISLEGFPVWGGGFYRYGGSYLTWNDALTDIVANAGQLSLNLIITTEDKYDNGRYGSFQFGLCPTVAGGPCGYMTSIDSMNIAGLPIAVPGPIVGTGLPGLLLAGILLIWWRFRSAVSLQDVT